MKSIKDVFKTEERYLKNISNVNDNNISMFISVFGLMIIAILVLMALKLLLFSIFFFFLAGVMLGYLIRSVYLTNKIRSIKKSISKRLQ
jgi:multisubunit Na+/H+ antiporter MnhG subunit